MDISQRGRAVALSFLSPLPELRRWSSRLPPPRPLSPPYPPRSPSATYLFAFNCFFLFHHPSYTRFAFFSLFISLSRFPWRVSSRSPLAISRLADELNRAGGPPYFCLAGRVHSPRHCSDCDQTETSWALLLAESYDL